MLLASYYKNTILTCTAMLCEDETICATLTTVPAYNSRTTVALSSLFMTLITHTAMMVTVTRFARSTLKLWETKPPIAAPVFNSK